MDSRIISNPKKKNCTQFFAHFSRNWQCCVDCFQLCPRRGLGHTMEALAGFKRLICGITAEIWKMAQWRAGACCRVIKEIPGFLGRMAQVWVEGAACCSQGCRSPGAWQHLWEVPGSRGEMGMMHGCDCVLPAPGIPGRDIQGVVDGPGHQGKAVFWVWEWVLSLRGRAWSFCVNKK